MKVHDAWFSRLFRCVVFVASTGPSALFALQIHPGDLIVVDSHNLQLPNHGVIIDINPTTGAQTTISADALEQPTFACLDPNGAIIVADYGYVGGGGIFRINPTTGQQTLISGGGLISHPTAVVRDSKGDLIVTQHGLNQAIGAVLKINATTGVQTLIASGNPLSVPESLAIEPNGNYLVSNFQSPVVGSSILRIDANSGAQSVVSSGGHFDLGPFGVWLNNLSPHSLLVASNSFVASSELINVDTNTGAQSVISSGGQLVRPIGVTQDPAGNIFVADQGQGTAKILRIDPLTGVQSIVSSGGNLSTPLGIFVATPEPSSLLLAAVGFIGLATWDWRRRSRSASV